MAEIAVNLKGQDNLTNTVKNATKAVDELKYHSTELGKASKEFDRITNSGKSLKAQLAMLKKLMAEMNMKGLSNTDEFTKIAQAAGQIKDAIGDADAAINKFSSDTQNLDAAVSAIQGLAGVGTIATGAMALLGEENENVQKSILKVQAALSILNGVQAISNTLNKDSALLQKIKQIRLAATTRTEIADTAATTVNTAATTANTVATTANTAAQKAWNVAKAIGKAMFGDFTGLVLLGIGAVAAYAIATHDATDAEEERNKALEEAQKKEKDRQEQQEKFAQSVANSAATQIAAYIKLQDKWKECNGDVKLQQQFMHDYKTELDNTGFAVNSLTDAENFFVDNTDAVIEAIMKRAEAQANYELMVESLKKGLQAINSLSVENGGLIYTPTKANLTDAEKAALEKEFGKNNYLKIESMDAGAVGLGGEPNVKYGGLTKQAEEYVRQMRKRNARVVNAAFKQQTRAQMEEEVNAYLKAYKEANEEGAEIMKKANLKPTSPHGKTGTTPHKTNTTTTKEETKALKGSLEDMENEYNKIQKALSQGLVKKENFETAKQRMKELKKDIENEKIRLGFQPPKAVEGSINNLKEQLNEIQKKLQDGLIPDEDVEKTLKKVKELQDQIDAKELQFKIKPIEGSIEDIQEQINRLNEKLQKENLELNARVEIQTKIGELQKQLDELVNGQVSIKPMVRPQFMQKGTIDDLRQSYENAQEIINEYQSDLEKGIITEEQFKSKVKELNEEIQKLGMKPIEIEFKSNIEKIVDKLTVGLTAFDSFTSVISSIDQMADKMKEGVNAWEQFVAIVQVAESILTTFSTIQTVINTLSKTNTKSKLQEAAATQAATAATGEKAAADTAAIPTTTANTVALKAQEAAYMDTAAAALFAAHASIPFAGVGIASGMVAAMMAAMTAQHAASAALAAFKEGGIVGGSMYEHPILAHKGEMILNEHQQQKLFDILDSGGSVNNMGNVQFVLKGSDLYGSFSNYTKIKSKVGKI